MNLCLSDNKRKKLSLRFLYSDLLRWLYYLKSHPIDETKFLWWYKRSWGMRIFCIVVLSNCLNCSWSRLLVQRNWRTWNAHKLLVGNTDPIHTRRWSFCLLQLFSPFISWTSQLYHSETHQLNFIVGSHQKLKGMLKSEGRETCFKWEKKKNISVSVHYHLSNRNGSSISSNVGHSFFVLDFGKTLSLGKH